MLEAVGRPGVDNAGAEGGLGASVPKVGTVDIRCGRLPSASAFLCRSLFHPGAEDLSGCYGDDLKEFREPPQSFRHADPKISGGEPYSEVIVSRS